MSTLAMFEYVMTLDTRPFLPADLPWMLPERPDAQFVPDEEGPSMRQGLAHVRLMPYGVDFYLVKLFLSRGRYGDKHQFMVMIGHDGGETWEQGPTFIRPGKVADFLNRIASRHQTVDDLLRQGGPPGP